MQIPKYPLALGHKSVVMRIVFRTFISGLFVALALPASAEPQEVEIAAETDWKHQWTPMRFPASLGDFKRDRIYQFQERESDIAANYLDPAGNLLSLYVYRPGLAEAPIWHDRALVSLGANDAMFGSDGVQGKRSATFAPTGAKVESGLLTVLTSSGAFRSTGIAIYSSGDWLIKVRLSSRGLDPEGLEGLLREVLLALPEMPTYSGQDAYLIEPCLDTVEYTTAERLKNDGTGAGSLAPVLNGPLLDVLPKPKNDAVYCRVGDGGNEGSIYRPDSAKERYIVAMGDSGTSVEVGPQMTLDEALASSLDETGESPVFQVSYTTALAIRHFMPFRSLPSPAQATRAVFKEPAISTITRALGDENAEISVTLDKDM